MRDNRPAVKAYLRWQHSALQEENEMYLTGGATSDYDDDPLTYRATIHRRLPILGKLVRQVLCCSTTSG